MLAQLAQIFSTPISDLRELRMWEINELVGLANEQQRHREQAVNQAKVKRGKR